MKKKIVVLEIFVLQHFQTEIWYNCLLYLIKVVESGCGTISVGDAVNNIHEQEA